MRSCRNCGERVPTRMTIDGKLRNLQKRKFCLTCSPFGSNNRRNNLQISKNEKDEKEVLRRKKNNEAVSRRRRKVIQMAIEYKGGACAICRYNKSTRAMHFHHINPYEKEFTISSASTRSWNAIKSELDKCILLCSNCHMEVEEGITLLDDSLISVELERKNSTNDNNCLENSGMTSSNIHSQVNLYGVVNEKTNSKKSLCINCNKPIHLRTKSKMCISCFNKSREYNHVKKVQNRPSKEQLIKLILTKPFVQIGLDFDVSDNAIRKWCKSYDLPYRKKDIEEQREQLEQIIQKELTFSS